jgi:hypothetical protein
MRFAIAVATTLTLLFAAPARAATTNTEPGFYIDQIAVSGWIGGEFGDLDGIYLRADGAVPIWNPLPQLQLLGVASLGFTHLGDSNSYWEISWNMVRVLASARGQWTFNEQWDVFADLGFGFYFGGWKSEVDTGLGTYEADDTTGGGTMRIAAGGHFAINEQMKVGAEMGWNPYWGDADTTNFFMGAGFEYAF